MLCVLGQQVHSSSCGVFCVLCGLRERFSVHPVEVFSRQAIREGSKGKDVNLRSLQRIDQEVGSDSPERNSREREKNKREVEGKPLLRR